jgi:uncharacterized membrane protein
MSSLSLNPAVESGKISGRGRHSTPLAKDVRVMRMVLFLAVVANSVDLVATTLGIHWLGNREGNPLLAGLVQNHWGVFVLLKGLVIPLLILQLNAYRKGSPRLATAGIILVTIALTIAVGQWLGWMAGKMSVAAMLKL